MEIRAHYAPVDGTLDTILPNIADLDMWMFWLLPLKGNFIEELQKISDALAPLQGIIRYHEQASTSFEKRGRDPQQRAFLPKSKLAQNLVARTTIEYLVEVDKPIYLDKVFSDVAWITPDALHEVDDLLKRIYDTYIDTAFIPKTEKAAWQWSRIVLGMDWRILGNEWSIGRPLPDQILNDYEILSSYIAMTVDIGGVPIIDFTDEYEGSSKGFILFGNKPTLDKVNEAFSDVTPLAIEGDIMRYRRGYVGHFG